MRCGKAAWRRDVPPNYAVKVGVKPSTGFRGRNTVRQGRGAGKSVAYLATTQYFHKVTWGT